MLGTVPLAADGSFYAEVPADRLMHFQVLDSDRRVLGNQLTWIQPRPGETRSCVGCHEHKNSVPRSGLGTSLAMQAGPQRLEPFYDEDIFPNLEIVSPAPDDSTP